MSRVVTLLVAIGLVEAVALGYSFGFDVAAVTIFGTLLGVGALAIVVARKSERGGVGPATCAACGGLMSVNAPYCKHCGHRV